jgi:lipopolysaccharide export system permease protein
MVADSGRIHYTADKKYLLLSLYNGESFANEKKQKTAYDSKSILYRREIFGSKDILLDFDSDFERYDENVFADQHGTKNVAKLTQSIDSIKKVTGARITEQSAEMLRNKYPEKNIAATGAVQPGDSIAATEYNAEYSADTFFVALEQSKMEKAVQLSIQKATDMKNHVEYNKILLSEPQSYMKRHQIERHRKFTLSFACLIFFFIGAPLGAIIRKGGLGMPIVVSVLMFIFYYIIDTTGYKMARQDLMTALEGTWLSSAILLPIGIFLSYKAAVDATLFRKEFYERILHAVKILFRRAVAGGKKRQ